MEMIDEKPDNIEKTDREELADLYQHLTRKDRDLSLAAADCFLAAGFRRVFYDPQRQVIKRYYDPAKSSSNR